ncbi:MAG TPA: HAMP domain-containing sensor histidine kinase [Gemmatimonadaceae bacterium]
MAPQRATDIVLPLVPWVDADQPAEHADAVLWRALDGAARLVRYEENTRAGAASGPDSECDDTIDALCTAVRAVASEETPALTRIPPTAPVERLISRLRVAFIDRVSALPEPPATPPLLRVLRAFDDVQHIIEQDPGRRFAGRLAGPEGLELIVEVAHDLRSPLSSILFLADTLRRGQSGPLNTVQERQLGLVYSAALGLSAMASDVIELARGGDRLMDRHPVPFSVSDILQSVRDVIQPMAEEKGLEVRLVPPEVDYRVGYPSALNRVLLNLTTNALKFTERGTVEVIAKQASRTRVEFSVRDTGRGIPDDVLATLFEPFRRRTSTDYSFSSAGLGLSICRKLVLAMGSDLQIDTALGKGTRFSFELELPLEARL